MPGFYARLCSLPPCPRPSQVGDERKKKAGHGGGEGGAPVMLFWRSLCKVVLYEDNNILLFCV